MVLPLCLAALVAGLVFMSTQEAGAQGQVIVIGSGISGIAAARKLQQSGVDVVLLEARSRKGGRLHTIGVAGVPVDLGGQWIHGTEGNPLTALAKQYGLGLATSTEANTMFDATGKEVNDTRANALVSRFYSWLATQRRTRGAFTIASTLQDAFDTWLATQTMDSATQQLVLQTMNSAIVQEYAADLRNLSALWYDNDEAFDGNDAVWRDGYSSLIEALAQGLNILYNQQVVSVDYTSSPVVVTTATGHVYQAPHVICTIPIGVLQSANAPTFTPALPARKRTAISTLGMGLLMKVIMKFPRAFWTRAAPTEWINMLPVAETGAWTEFYALSKPLGTSFPVVVAFAGGEFAWRTESLTDEVIIAQVTQRLQTLFKDAYVAPTDVVITRWGRDPFSLGSYPYLKAGASGEAFDIMSEPVQNKLFFAGDGTNPEYFSTAHGALMSGEREADRILDLLSRR